MPKASAGLMVYRRGAAGIELLLVHPGGPFWAKKDKGAWTIPKGEIAPGEEPLAAARREFREETGHGLDGTAVVLGTCRQAGGKLVHGFAVEAALDADAIVSNRFEMEWPPRSGRRQSFPEIDRAQWFPLMEARVRINPGQTALIDALEALIRET